MKIGIAFIETLEDIPPKAVKPIVENISTIIDSEPTTKPYLAVILVVGLCVMILLFFLFRKKLIKLPILFLNK